MTHMLALDQSTSATKAVLFDANGLVVDRAVREHRQLYPQPGWVEHDAEEIWQNVLAVIGELASRRGKLAAAAGLAITNQRETVVVFDRRTGRPLHNAIVWQCRRGDTQCDELRKAGHEATIRRKTGLRLDTYFSASKLSWLIRNRPDIRERLQVGEALFGTIDTYLIYRLTGGAVFATDSTNASRTLLFDLGRLRWDEELCTLFDVPMRALPVVRESFAHFGHTDAAGRLLEKVPICGVLGDSQASLFAQRCYEPGMVKATFGSGTSVLLNTGNSCNGKPTPSAAANALAPITDGVVTALAWAHNGHPTYGLEGIVNYSSATVSWLKDQLGMIRDAAETETLARAVEDNGGVYLVPAFSGLSTPHWSPDARAALVGMTAFTRREHVVRAALEAIAYQIRDVLEMLARHTGDNPRALHADGGPTSNGFLMQFTADLTQLPLIVSSTPDSSARGAALAGMVGLGVCPSLADVAKLPHEIRRYEPRMSAEQARTLHFGWRAAVKRVL